MNEELSRYQRFVSMLRECSEMADSYLHRCIIDGRVQTADLYYFKNLFALQLDNFNGKVKILGSTTDPNCSNESTKSYNIRFLNIDQDLFNLSTEDFDKGHINKVIFGLVDKLSTDEKIQLYDALKESLEDNDNL